MLDYANPKEERSGIGRYFDFYNPRRLHQSLDYQEIWTAVSDFNSYQFYWVHVDYLGSSRKLTKSDGGVVYRGEFDPHRQKLME